MSLHPSTLLYVAAVVGYTLLAVAVAVLWPLVVDRLNPGISDGFERVVGVLVGVTWPVSLVALSLMVSVWPLDPPGPLARWRDMRRRRALRHDLARAVVRRSR